MWNYTDITKRLKITYPIIQGPFGGGLSSIKLLAEVSNAGGLGSFGAHYMSADEIRLLVSDIRRATDKPFAINLWVSDEDNGGLHISKEEFEQNLSRLMPYFQELGIEPPTYPERFGHRFNEQIEAILETKPPVFSFVYGIPSESILDQCRKFGIVTIGAATTPDEAAALDDAGVDMIVATGFEAGGHRPSFMRKAEDSLTGTLSLVPQVVDSVKAPVIAAGGIADGRGVVAALSLGAKSVQIGTAFLACEESGANELHRKLLFSENAKYTALTRVFTGRLARSIKNRLIEELGPIEKSLSPFPSQSWFIQQLKKTAVEQGRYDLISLWAGQSAPLIRHKRAEDLIRSLVDETDRLFGKLNASRG